MDKMLELVYSGTFLKDKDLNEFSEDLRKYGWYINISNIDIQLRAS